MYLFIFRLTILVILLSGMRVYADTQTTTDLIQALSGCHDLRDTTLEYTLSETTTILIAADPDPNGYCLIGLRTIKIPYTDNSSAGDAADTPATPQGSDDTDAGSQSPQTFPYHMCSLGKSDIDNLTSPGIPIDLTNTTKFAPDPQLSPNVKASINKVLKCFDQQPQEPNKPPTPVEPAKPAGVPAGTPLALPPGVVAAPGTTPPGTPPGMVLTPSATAPGATANPSATPANTTNQSQ